MADNTAEQYEETYSKIISFYDFAEELINTVEYDSVEDPESQLAFIEPLVKKIEDATDFLADEYRNFVRTGKKPNKVNRKKIEQSLAQIYVTIDTCKSLSQKQEENNGYQQ